MTISDADRAFLQSMLQEFNKAARRIRELAAPFDKARADIAGMRDALLEHYGVEVAGTCETCDRLCFAGEQGHVTAGDENLLFCEEDAPVWGDLKADLDHDPTIFEDPDWTRKAIAAHLAGGGSLDDKILRTLDPLE